MSIRPIELQVLIPRVGEIGKVQQISDRQMLLQQQQVADQWINISQRRNNQVQNVNKSEAKKIHNEDQNRNSSADTEQQYETDQSSPEQDVSKLTVANHPSNDDPILGHIVDIKT